MKNPFDAWPTLQRCLDEGTLAFIDLAFAQTLKSSTEAHAAFLSHLFALSRQGHLALNLDTLEGTLDMLGVKERSHLAALIREGAETLPAIPFVKREGSYGYLQKNWAYESEIVHHLQRLSRCKPTITLPVPEGNTTLNQQQFNALQKGVGHSLSLLTGGPGTGKTFTATHIVKAILASLPEEKKSQFRILLAAPTGKAVAQLEGNLRQGLAAQVKAGTLHALLGIKGTSHEEESLPLFADLIIVDESSMIDAKLFARLLASILDGTRLILIGDKDQLPPVEAGSIFADLIELGRYPTTHLTECLRSDRQEILRLAKHVKEGNVAEALAQLKNSTDIAWTPLEGKMGDQLLSRLWEECKAHYPAPFPDEPTAGELLAKLGSFSILSCMRQGPLGVDALNRFFLHQSLKNTPKGSFWVAPIMITRNDHELRLYNGDLGFLVRKIGEDFSLKHFHQDDYALFEDREGGFRRFSALALNTFEYSYCLSVHKSQGSEYDGIFILAPDGSEQFGREVLYTALTRARQTISLAAGETLLSRSIGASSRRLSGLLNHSHLI